MSKFETDILSVWRDFQDLTATEMTKAVKRALNKAAQQLQSTTKMNLSTMLKHDTGHGGKYSDRLSDGVRRTGARGNYDEDLTAVVHIMGTRSSTSGTYRLRFFEKGTQPRYAQTYKGQPLKKPRYTGSVRPMHFFKTANDTIEPQLETIYAEELNNTIEKINHTS